MIFGYVNIFNEKSSEYNSINTQVLELFYNGCSRVVEERSTATVKNRPKLNQLLKELEPGDTFMIAKLENIAETLNEVNEIVNDLIGKGVKVSILNIGVIDNTNSAELIKNMLLAFIEFEHNMSVIKKQDYEYIELKGETRRKKYSEKTLNNALSLLTINGGAYSYNKVVAITGISRSTLLREQKKRKKNELEK